MLQNKFWNWMNSWRRLIGNFEEGKHAMHTMNRNDVFVLDVHTLPVPQPRPRARIVKFGNNQQRAGVHDDPKSKVHEYRYDLRRSAEETFEYPPWERAIKVIVTFYFARPNNHFGTGRNAGVLKKWAPVHCTKKVDLDNLLKSTFDALNGIIYVDDSQIVNVVATKKYIDDSGGVGVSLIFEQLEK